MLGILKIMERNKFTFLFLLFFILFTSNVSAITTTNKTTITSGSLTNGAISITSSTSKAGETVTFTVSPATGYKLKAGTLKYTYDYSDSSGNTKSKTVNLSDSARSLTIPDKVTASVYSSCATESCRQQQVLPFDSACAASCQSSSCSGLTGEDREPCLEDCWWACAEFEEVCTCKEGNISKTYYTSNITITAEFELDIADYTVYHYIEQLDGSYKLYATENKSGTIGSNVDLNSIIKSIKGFF